MSHSQLFNVDRLSQIEMMLHEAREELELKVLRLDALAGLQAVALEISARSRGPVSLGEIKRYGKDAETKARVGLWLKIANLEHDDEEEYGGNP